MKIRRQKKKPILDVGVGGQRWLVLNEQAAILREAFGTHPYLVGSATRSKEWHDIDVVLILDDAEFDRLFGGFQRPMHVNARWSLICSAISIWMMQRLDARVDFKIQPQKQADTFEGARVPLGVFIANEYRTWVDEDPG